MTSILTTDGYKFSMAQAGFPLRHETFYLSFRKGGWQYIPFDLEAAVEKMTPFGGATNFQEQFDYLEKHGYGMATAMAQALGSEVKVRAAPAGSWVYQREPILTISGPSFIVSWLEPLVLRLFYPIQLATLIQKHNGDVSTLNKWRFSATCEEQAELAGEVIEALSFRGLENLVEIRKDDYQKWVQERVDSLTAVVDPSRIFEVGMRATTCEGQHRIALEICREAGIKGTSNVALARELDMNPVGTMGHEHIQRWGNDLAAYRAMRDMRPGYPSYLLDTFDTITSGIPAAVQVMKEQHHNGCSIRYDSGDKFGQYIYAHGEFQRHGLEPTHIIEDGLTAEMTAKFEKLREHTGLAPEKQVYGYGGFIVDRGFNGIGRDEVSAVYKLTQTSGEPRMKFGNEAGLGKVSIPGHPVTWRRLRGSGPISIIGQLNEPVPEDYVVLNGNPDALDQLRMCNVRCEGKQPYTLSPETQRLVNQIKEANNG